ncbi:guanylyl cyclase [Mesorhizobium sp. WSM4303]|uniref:adenylate/guanylate cyclase domain-containing protein n=1 Tax=unclassified Mesorhizobium TaxID=325217 RepID=UPI00115F5918|nr:MULTISPECIES: adenylate/guanylate cyclase domain-containing protein [unclassified Mesorhizobium]TRC96835.1 guanylyl cyclase [Mesorhizobium sp. WSM4306]TRD08511.1 guanylyl cyclase [Mesorhizobium sp. WSM4303]
MERRLTAILAADVVGYSRLMGEDEVGTLERLKGCRRELVDPAIKEFHGRIIKLMGDGALVEFASVVDAIQCAVMIQRRMADRNKGTADGRHIRFRIGVNLGDVIVEENDIYGDGVNIAARLEAMAEPGGVCISGTAFDHALHKVDVGFASLGEQRLKNIADPIRAYQLLLDPAAAGKIKVAVRRPVSPRAIGVAGIAVLLVVLLAGLFVWQSRTSSLAERPSVAVLPFTNLGGDPGQDYFADGITEDLITDLTKLSGLDVIARNSVFAYKNKPAALADVARDLGVRYVVEGSVRRTGEQIRLNVQLIDTATGDNLWANRFDRGMAGVFAVQDEMSGEIAKALGIRASAAESERMARPPTKNLEAYDYYLQAETASRSGLLAGLREALTLYDKAEGLDPAFAEAFAADARTTVYIWREAFNDIIQSAPARKRAYEKASRALELEPDLSSPYAILGIMQVVNRRYEDAIASAKKAVSIGPGDAEAQAALGYVQLCAGNYAEAAAAVETALRLDPDLSAINRETAGLVFLLQGNVDKAIEILERSRDDASTVGNFRFTLAAAYVRGGRLPDAKAEIAVGLRLVAGSSYVDSLAGWQMTHAHFRNPQDLAILVNALRQAGLPQWRYGFTPDEHDQLKGAEIASLVIGHTLQGQIEPGLQPAFLQIGSDGKAAFRTTTRLVTETVYVDGDLLCEQSENLFGRPDCGPVYRRNDAAGKGYSYANTSKVFHFTVVR